MKLSSKIAVSQILVTIGILLIGLLAIPEIIYRSFRNNVRSDVANYSVQITDNISQRLVDIRRVTSVLAGDTSLKEKINDYIENPSESKQASISLYLSGFYISESLPSYKVLGIYISMDEKDADFCTVGFSEGVRTYLDQEVLPEVKEMSNEAMLVSPFTYENDSTTIFANQFDKLYGYSMRYKVGNREGTVTVVSPYSDISYLLSGVEDFSKDYLLLDGNNHVIFSAQNYSGIDISNTLNNLYYGDTYQIGYLDDDQGFSVVTFTTYGNWKLICRLTRNEIIERNGRIFEFVVILLLVFELLANVITILVADRVLKPLHEVSSKMHEVAAGNMHVRIAYQSQDEVGDVVGSFNTMTRKLEDNIQTLIKKEKTEQKLRYGILISKVDPHFIYNTMNTITYLAERNRSEDVVTVNKAMIDIMRDRLRIELTDVFDTLDQEIWVLKQYYTIQQYRFEGVFKYTIDIQEGIGNLYIAKSVLQPIAENALLHGILTNRDEDGEMLGGCVSLRAEEEKIHEKKMIRIQVKDNGSGMTPEQLQDLKSLVTKDLQSDSIQKGLPGKERGRHVGLRNIQDRLQLLYEGEASMEIESVLGVGTVVTLFVPALTQNTKKI